jgi:cytochrome c oxidase assembly factor CtaG
MSWTSFFADAWDWKPSVICGCFLLIVGYLWLVRFRLSARFALWVAGVFLILMALVSPFDELADTYLFSMHMAKHMLFVLVVPALLLLGLPEAPMRSILRHRSLARLEHVLNNPAVSWISGIGVMAIWHIPAFFNAALANEGLHIAEHISLLIGGTIFWWPILSPVAELRLRAIPEAASYLFLACLACTSIGILITFAPKILYAAYIQPQDSYGILPLIRERFGITPAIDQQTGGLFMWVPGCLVYLTAIMAMFARWYRDEPGLAVKA